MKSKIHNGMIVLNKKNINNILDYFCENSDLGLEYVSGMINMINLFGIIVYRKGMNGLWKISIGMRLEERPLT